MFITATKPRAVQQLHLADAGSYNGDSVFRVLNVNFPEDKLGMI